MTETLRREMGPARQAAIPLVALFTLGLWPGVACACTVIAARDDSTVLFAGNEDSSLRFPRVWFIPPDPAKFGRMYLGFESLGRVHPQAGVNDQGLAFDILAAPPLSSTQTWRREPYLDTYGNLIVKVMEECATVAEALALFDRYSCGDTWSGQYMLADRCGDAAIVEIDSVYLMKDRPLVATNFYRSITQPSDSRCERFRIASEMLSRSRDLSVGLFREVLAAVRMSGETPTRYSYVFSLTRGTASIYYTERGDQAIELDLSTEFASNARSIELPTLFHERHGDNSERPIVTLLIDAYRDAGIEQALGAYRSVRALPTSPYITNEWLLKVFGWELADEGHGSDALVVFKLIADEFPESADAHEKLGWAFMNDGQIGRAIVSYERAAKLNPASRAARLMLERLRSEAPDIGE